MTIGMAHRAAARRGHSFARGTMLALVLLGVGAFEASAAQQTQDKPSPKQAKDSESAPAPKTSASPTGASASNAAGSSSNAAGASSNAQKQAGSPDAVPPQAAQQDAAQQDAAPPEEQWHRMSGTPAPAAPSNTAPPSNGPAQPAAMANAAELRTRLNELGIRANNANQRLQSLQEQQSREGLALRADIRETQSRMDQQMQESAKALESGNLEAARENLRYAQNAVETIEKFLGR